MVKCPVLLSLQLYEKRKSHSSFFDVLVKCPETLSLNFNISNADGNMSDVFILIVNDSLASYQVVLTSVVNPLGIQPGVPESYSQHDPEKYIPENGGVQWTGVVIVVVTSLTVCLLSAVFHCIIRAQTNRKLTDPLNIGVHNADAYHAVTALLGSHESRVSANQTAFPNRAQATLGGKRRLRCLFVLSYVVYSLLFTFSFTTFLVHSAVHTIMGRVENASLLFDVEAVFNVSFDKVILHESQEEMRLRQEVQRRVQACEHHLHTQNVELLRSYQETITHYLTSVYEENGHIDHLARKSISTVMIRLNYDDAHMFLLICLACTCFSMYIWLLSTIIDSHSFAHHPFADDLHLQMFAPDKISELLHSMQSCMNDVKAWSTVNMFKLNDNKIELILVTSKN